MIFDLLNSINCPACNTVCIVKYNSSGSCSNCGQAWKSDSYAIEWTYDLVEPYYGEKSAQWLADRKATGFNKFIFLVKESQRKILKLAAFPLRRLSDLRVENYYARTLSDKGLAISWASHYFHGVSIPAKAVILDHGCGRGRIVGILSQLGYVIAGQEIRSHSWWKNIDNAYFQIVSPDRHYLPWKDATFDVVLNFGVICHLTDAQLYSHAREVERILRPGGYWILLENNHRYYGAAYAKKWYGRVHTEESIKMAALSAGLQETHFSYEGFWSPVFPQVIEYFRKIFFSKQFDISDYNSRLAKMIPSDRRRWCLFHFQKNELSTARRD